VSAYLDDPETRVVVMASAVEIGVVEELEGGGHRSSSAYRLAGIRSHATAESTEFEADERLVFHVEGGLTAEYRVEFAGGAGSNSRSSTNAPGRSGTASSRPSRHGPSSNGSRRCWQR
jgi:hypothetical protein